jgi:hypothetical protein
MVFFSGDAITHSDGGLTLCPLCVMRGPIYRRAGAFGSCAVHAAGRAPLPGRRAQQPRHATTPNTGKGMIWGGNEDDDDDRGGGGAADDDVMMMMLLLLLLLLLMMMMMMMMTMMCANRWRSCAVRWRRCSIIPEPLTLSHMTWSHIQSRK